VNSVQICSICPEEIFLPGRTFNTAGYRIQACPPDKPFSSIVINDMIDEKKIYTEYDWTKAERIPIPIPVEQIIADYFSSEKLAQKGCFVLPAGEIPTEEHIRKAKFARLSWLQMLVQEGDKEYKRNGKIDQIPDVCKRAVSELRINREWAFQAPGQMIDCPACGESLKAGVAICKSCGAILDREKAVAFGLVGELVSDKKSSSGRSKKSEAEPEDNKDLY
jgi:hypothetical protein